MAEKKKSFVFNVEWQEILLEYPAEVRLEVYDAVIRYAASGTLSELKPMAKMAFSFIKKEIDYNNERYEETVSKRKEAGKKGMLSRYSGKKEQEELTKLTSDNKTNTCYSCYDELTEDNKTNKSQQKVTNVTDNVYDNDIKETTTKVVAKKSAAKAATNERKQKFYESLIPFVDKYGKELIRDFFDYWSEFNRSGTKMRFESEKTWETNLRLSTWERRSKDYARGKTSDSKPIEPTGYGEY